MLIKETVDLPLHGGKCPSWLFNKMVKLSGEISELIIEEQGKKEFFEKISNPFWFQAFGCVLGFDWHSSGLTTTTLAALKEALEKKNLGVYIAGGKGKYSFNTPKEILEKLDNKKGEKFVEYSKLTAKIDNNLVQDSYDLYLHFFIFDEKNWAVIQQGKNDFNNYARRYHWYNSENFFKEPHNGVFLNKIEKKTFILTKEENYQIQEKIIELKEYSKNEIINLLRNQKTLSFYLGREIKLPKRHNITKKDLSERDLKYFEILKEIDPTNFEELLKIKGVGKKGIRALGLIASLVYGDEIDWKDFVKYSFSHGGKDKTPFPINKKVYLNSILTLEDIIKQTKIKEKEKQHSLRRLHNFLNKMMSK